MADKDQKSNFEPTRLDAQVRPVPSSLEPKETVTIQVKLKNFKMHRVLLTEDSLYFKVVLEKVPAAPYTQEIDHILPYDDIQPAEFEVYGKSLYRFCYIPPDVYTDFSLDPSGTCTCIKAACLWKLSNRFRNQRLRGLADKVMNDCKTHYTKPVWEEIYKQGSEKALKGVVRGMQLGFAYCITWNLPFQEHFVEMASNMPGQLFKDAIRKDTISDVFCSRIMYELEKRRPPENTILEQRPSQASPPANFGALCELETKNRVVKWLNNLPDLWLSSSMGQLGLEDNLDRQGP